MCCGCVKVKNSSVYKFYDTDGELNFQDSTIDSSELPERVDNALLNRNLQTGILGFRYETKNATLIVYSSIEAKTFCILMNLMPMHK